MNKDVVYICNEINAVAVQPLSRVQLFSTPSTAACQASLSFTISLSLLKLTPIESDMPSIYRIFCGPFVLLPLPFPASSSLPMSQLFESGGQIIAASESVTFNKYSGWISFRIGWLDLLAVQGISKVFSRTTVQKHQFFSAQPYLWSNSHICTWLLEKPQI